MLRLAVPWDPFGALVLGCQKPTSSSHQINVPEETHDARFEKSGPLPTIWDEKVCKARNHAA
ncbi:hypothetical protein WG66_008340 [Moniliophthora roreri]|nr:hypothetical protein WG66_008340 [Moniliophthora roreri]